MGAVMGWPEKLRLGPAGGHGGTRWAMRGARGWRSAGGIPTPLSATPRKLPPHPQRRNGESGVPLFRRGGVAAKNRVGRKKMENYGVKRSGQQHATSMKDEVWLTAYVVADDK